MKTMLKMFSGLVLVVMIASCATTPLVIPEKYNLGNELEEVKEITKYTVTSWETVDTQSIILTANVSDYYLLVLDRRLIGLITSERIGVSSTVTSIKAGYDKIYVKDDTGTNYYTIDRIYKLKGRDQAKEIKERFRGK